MAGEWACKIGNNGYINKYSLHLDGLNVLNLLDKKFNILNWMALLLANRTFRISSPIGHDAKKYIMDNFLIDINGYDIIKGYRADDSYFSFAQVFIENTLSIQGLNKALYLGKLGEQIVLCSPKAFENIEYLDNEIAKKEIYHPMFMLRDRLARKEYREKVSHIVDVKLGLSQSQLAKASGVNLRNIQLYEQKVNDIDKASGTILYRLAKALHCSMEDLLEEIS